MSTQCHNTAHPLGRRIYRDAEQHLDLAVGLCQYRCNGGCLHGVMEALLEHYSEQATLAPQGLASLRWNLSKVFRAVQARNVTTEGDAAHGLGHALVVAQGTDPSSVARSVSFCTSAFETAEMAVLVQSVRSLAHYCVSGVSMQLTTGSGNNILKDGSYAAGAKVCASWPAAARASCFYYRVRHWFSACSSCESIKGDRLLGCWLPTMSPRWCAPVNGTRGGDAHAIAAAMAESAIAFCVSLERAALTPQSGVLPSCIYGFSAGPTLYPLLYLRDPQGAVLMCEQLSHSLRPACIDGLVFRAARYFPAGAVLARSRSCARTLSRSGTPSSAATWGTRAC